MLYRLKVSRYRFLIPLLCLLVALLALHTRLSPYESQKTPIKVFADCDWLRAQPLDSKIRSAGVLYWAPAALMACSMPFLRLLLHRHAICLVADGVSLELRFWGSPESVRPPPLR
jgi:hypothetical protein